MPSQQKGMYESHPKRPSVEKVATGDGNLLVDLGRESTIKKGHLYLVLLNTSFWATLVLSTHLPFRVIERTGLSSVLGGVVLDGPVSITECHSYDNVLTLRGKNLCIPHDIVTPNYCINKHKSVILLCYDWTIQTFNSTLSEKTSTLKRSRDSGLCLGKKSETVKMSMSFINSDNTSFI